MGVLTKMRQFVLKILGINQVLYNQSLMFGLFHEQHEMQKHQIELQQEVLKSNLFRDSINDCKWLKCKSFSPGGWAVDYAVLYTLYRVLNNMKPKNILEFGFGQSSRILHQYGCYFQDVNVLTCEHDRDFVAFFQSEIEEYPINICILELENRIYRESETLVYKGLESVTKGQVYDLIVVDGPFGSEHYSRSQLIDLVNEGKLAERFCIIMDDYNRIGEQETVAEVTKLLDAKNIAYCSKRYIGAKQHFLICSKDLKFLTTLSWI